MKPIGFKTGRGRSRRDPRRNVEGGDIFQRRALKDALTAVEKGTQLSPLTRKTLGVTDANAGEVRGALSERLARGTTTRAGSSFSNQPLPDRLAAGRKSLFERRGSAFSQPGLDGPNRKQAEFGARTSALTGRPFSDFQRRELGINKDNEDDFRSLLKRRR